MRSVAASDHGIEPVGGNVIPFRRPAAAPASRLADANPNRVLASPLGRRGKERADQRSLMDLVYATGSFLLAPGDRDTKLIASRLLVYGFLVVEEVGEDGSHRRLRPSEAIRARLDRPWRLSKASYGASLAVTIPAADDFLFEQPAGLPA